VAVYALDVSEMTVIVAGLQSVMWDPAGAFALAAPENIVSDVASKITTIATAPKHVFVDILATETIVFISSFHTLVMISHSVVFIGI
jgi:hypothetical protein